MKIQVQVKNLEAGDKLSDGVIVQSPPTNLGRGQVSVEVVDATGKQQTQVFNLRSYVSIFGK